jgi:hypothetical protein
MARWPKRGRGSTGAAGHRAVGLVEARRRSFRCRGDGAGRASAPPWHGPAEPPGRARQKNVRAAAPNK